MTRQHNWLEALGQGSRAQSTLLGLHGIVEARVWWITLQIHIIFLETFSLVIHKVPRLWYQPNKVRSQPTKTTNSDFPQPQDHVLSRMRNLPLTATKPKYRNAHQNCYCRKGITSAKTSLEVSSVSHFSLTKPLGELKGKFIRRLLREIVSVIDLLLVVFNIIVVSIQMKGEKPGLLSCSIPICRRGPSRPKWLSNNSMISHGWIHKVGACGMKAFMCTISCQNLHPLMQ